jgi:hypothetical protein
LTLHNLREKKGQELSVFRGSEYIQVSMKKTLELRDGDSIQLSSSLALVFVVRVVPWPLPESLQCALAADMLLPPVQVQARR